MRIPPTRRDSGQAVGSTDFSHYDLARSWRNTQGGYSALRAALLLTSPLVSSSGSQLDAAQGLIFAAAAGTGKHSHKKNRARHTCQGPVKGRVRRIAKGRGEAEGINGGGRCQREDRIFEAVRHSVRLINTRMKSDASVKSACEICVLRYLSEASVSRRFTPAICGHSRPGSRAAPGPSSRS